MERPEVVPIKNDDLKFLRVVRRSTRRALLACQDPRCLGGPHAGEWSHGDGSKTFGGNLAIAQAMSYDSVADIEPRADVVSVSLQRLLLDEAVT